MYAPEGSASMSALDAESRSRTPDTEYTLNGLFSEMTEPMPVVSEVTVTGMVTETPLGDEMVTPFPGAAPIQ